MGISASNIVCVVLAIGLLAFHTFLFTNLSDQLQTSIRRIDDLERLLKNATTKKSSDKTISSNCLEELQMRLDSELANADSNVKLLRVLRKIQRLEKRVEKCIVRSLRSKRYLDSRRPRRSYNNSSSGKQQYALYTIWGVARCPANSKIVHSGQMVTTDGSDFLCLSDNPEELPVRPRKTPGRNLGSSVHLRGVTYGDMEDVVNFFTKIPPSGPNSRNNKTVPCALCARCGKSGSKMIVAITSKVKKFYVQREYYGILMSTKESKKLICLSVDGRSYTNEKMKNTISSKFPLSNTVQLHPAELRCNSMYCEADKHYYKEGYRVKCMVVTF